MQELGILEVDAATYYLIGIICFSAARFLFTWLMKWHRPSKLLMWAAVAGLVLCTTVVLTPGTGMLNVIALTGISSFMSLMFPTIYGLALEDVAADDKKIGASGLIMAILGGAVITPVQGLISDAAGIHISYLVPVFCLVITIQHITTMQTLNKNTAPKRTYTEKVIQFGEGNFLRAFADWIIWKTNQKTDFKASVVVVQPTPRFCGLDYLEDQPKDRLQRIRRGGAAEGGRQGRYAQRSGRSLPRQPSRPRGIDPYNDFNEFLKLAEQPEMRFVISNTTEAGIAFDPTCKFSDKPAASYPGKLVQLLHHRYEHFKGDSGKGFIILPCELIFHNGKHLKECINQYIEHWNLGADFKNWIDAACPVYNTLVDRIVPARRTTPTN